MIGKRLGLEDDKGLAVRQPRDDGLVRRVGQHPHQTAGEGLARGAGAGAGAGAGGRFRRGRG